MKAKKSLGQHFLRSNKALRNIVVAGDLTDQDVVLEIGPGTGALTTGLLASGAKVVAVETDERMLPTLYTQFQNETVEGRFTVLHEDIQNFDPVRMLQYGNSYKLVANIPYYITGEIIRRFLDTSHKPEKMVLLVQKEVADRVIARDGKQSILSLSVAVYGKAKGGGVVKAKDFSPAPKVDSAILIIDDISDSKLEGVSKTKFFEVVKKGFSYKRKVLTNNFKGEDKKKVIWYLEQKNLPLNSRAEDLALSNWIELAKLL